MLGVHWCVRACVRACTCNMESDEEIAGGRDGETDEYQLKIKNFPMTVTSTLIYADGLPLSGASCA